MNQEVTTDSVSLRVNQSALIKNLKFSFSNSFTVLTELLQNARRAGASCVHIKWDAEKELLSVTDDGGGISDFQKLLTVAESGWDQEVIDSDSPFGMGFLSCMFAADKVTVHSNGRFIEFETSEALDFSSTLVRNSDRSLGVGTIVELHGGDIAKQMKTFPKLNGLRNNATTIDFVQTLVVGFPLPVFFNEVEVLRIVAVDSSQYTFFDTPVGKVSIKGLEEGACSLEYIEVFLQGIQVEFPRALVSGINYREHYDGWVVVHLDSRKFHGRMPDRDKLHNHSASMDCVHEAIKDVWRAHLTAKLEAMGEDAFLEKYRKATSTVFPELFNQLTMIPKEYVCRGSHDEILSIVNYSNDPVKPVGAHIKRADIESGKVRLFEVSSPCEENLAQWVYVMQTGGYTFYYGSLATLGKNHWALPYIIDLDNTEARVTVNGEGKSGNFSGNWVGGAVVLCDSYTVELKTKSGEVLTATVNDESLYTEEGVFIVPAESDGRYAVHKASRYQLESECVADDDLNQDDDEFCQIISLLRNQRSAVGIFKDRISTSNIFYLDALKQKTFITRIGNSRNEMVIDEFDDAFAVDMAAKLSQSGCNVDAETVKAAVEACMTRLNPKGNA